MPSGPFRCRHWHDISEGMLNSRQEIEWTGPVFAPPIREALPSLMDRFHFAAVQRSVLGAIRPRMAGDRVDCHLLGRWPALLFAHPETEATERRVVRVWRIEGGLLARPDPPVFGLLSFGWEVTGPPDSATHRLWASVEAYPSRMLRVPGRRPGPVWTVIGKLYGWYHARVTCVYLRRMARWLAAHGAAPPPGWDRILQ